MFSLFEGLALWSERHSRALTIAAGLALPGAFVVAFVLNSVIPSPPFNFALLLYLFAPVGIWSLGGLLSRIWFGSTHLGDTPTPLRRLSKGFGALFLTLWMLSPLGIVAVVAL
jgi:hypothetical protein